MKQSPIVNTFIIAAAIAFFMLLTRGSHVLTSVALPDASIVLFLLGGLWLKRASWFIAFFVLASVIDFGAAALDPAQGFCLTNGYWGLIPAYGTMWLGGLWLSKQTDAFSAMQYTMVAALTSFVAFVISTQTYYLFSGRFPAKRINRKPTARMELLTKLDEFCRDVFCCRLAQRDCFAQSKRHTHGQSLKNIVTQKAA